MEETIERSCEEICKVKNVEIEQALADRNDRAAKWAHEVGRTKRRLVVPPDSSQRQSSGRGSLVHATTSSVRSSTKTLMCKFKQAHNQALSEPLCSRDANAAVAGVGHSARIACGFCRPRFGLRCLSASRHERVEAL